MAVQIAADDLYPSRRQIRCGKMGCRINQRFLNNPSFWSNSLYIGNRAAGRLAARFLFMPEKAEGAAWILGESIQRLP